MPLNINFSNNSCEESQILEQCFVISCYYFSRYYSPLVGKSVIEISENNCVSTCKLRFSKRCPTKEINFVLFRAVVVVLSGLHLKMNASASHYVVLRFLRFTAARYLNLRFQPVGFPHHRQIFSNVAYLKTALRSKI